MDVVYRDDSDCEEGCWLEFLWQQGDNIRRILSVCGCWPIEREREHLGVRMDNI